MLDKSFSKQSLIEYGALSNEDIIIVNCHRGSYNKLGFAYQLIFIRLFNCLPQISPFEIIQEINIYSSIQLSLASKIIELYQNNRIKIAKHQQEIITYLGLVTFNESARIKVEAFIFDIALRLEASHLIRIETILFLKQHHILSPALDTLNRLLSGQRKKARQSMFDSVSAKINADIISKLNNLLLVVEGYSGLERLKTAPQRASVEALLNLTSRLKIIEDTGALDIKLDIISNNYQKILVL